MMKSKRLISLVLFLVLATRSWGQYADPSQQQQSHAAHSHQTAAYSQAAGAGGPYGQAQATEGGGHLFRQATAIAPTPWMGFLPIAFFIGITAIVIIPLIMLFWLPGFGGGFGPYGHKRSLGGQANPLESMFSMDSNVLEVFNMVSSGIQTHMKKFLNQAVQAGNSNKASPKSGTNSTASAAKR